MSKNLEIQELAIVVTAKNYDPNLLSTSFLKSSGIVAEEWELARQPIMDRRGSEVVFSNGVYLAAQPNRFTLVEALNNKEESEIKIASLASRYIEALKNLEYQAVGINFRGYIHCSQSEGELNNYLSEHFIAPGDWQKCGTEPVKAGLNLMFTYEQKQLYLSVNEAELKLPESSRVPIVLFGGNFDYTVNADNTEPKSSQLQSIINNWQQDLAIYKEVVNQMIDGSSEASGQKEQETVMA
jgi:hypothetical protein